MRETNGMAIASLVCGILGWTVLPVLASCAASCAAIVLGHVAKVQIRDSRGAVGGDGLATAGLVLGYSSLGIAVAGVVVAIVLSILGIVLPFGLFGCALCAGA